MPYKIFKKFSDINMIIILRKQIPLRKVVRSHANKTFLDLPNLRIQYWNLSYIFRGRAL